MKPTHEEIAKLQSRLVETYGMEVATLASMISFYYHCTQHVQPFADANLVLLTQVCRVYAHERGIDWGKLTAAVGAVEDSRKTLRYIMSLPE